MSESDEPIERPAQAVDSQVPDAEPTRSNGFVLRDRRYGRGGGVPGVDPNDWMSIKHLVRGAGG